MPPPHAKPMRITKVKHHRQIRYRVNDPNGPDGKRVRKFFDTREAAENYIKERTADTKAFGVHFTTIPPEERAAIAYQIQRLKAMGWTRAAAVDCIEKHGEAENASEIEFGSVAEEFLAAKSTAGLRPRYLKTLRASIRRFLIGRRQKLIGEITAGEIQEYIASNGWQPATMRSYLVDVRTLFAFAVKRNYLKENPALAVDLPKVEENPPGIVTPAQAHAIRASTGDSPSRRPPLFPPAAAVARGGPIVASKRSRYSPPLPRRRGPVGGIDWVGGRLHWAILDTWFFGHDGPWDENVNNQSEKGMQEMKALSLLSFGMALALSAQAALVKFQLSPPGTDVGVGLSPSNTVPQAVGSTGSGNTISGGIVFDTDSRMLSVAVGYGSAAGFTDLTAVPTTMHIHAGGPGTNGNVQINLFPLHFPAPNPTNGGVIVGTVTVGSEDVTNLLAGLLYLDLHTANYFSGEIRGQLIPISEPPRLACPPPAVIRCGESLTLRALVSDPEGDALVVLWSVNTLVVATNTVPAREPGLPAMTSITQDFPVGTNVVQVAVMDPAGNTESCWTEVAVLDTQPPVIGSARANPPVLWPPNNKLVDVRVIARVVDTCSDNTWKIIRVSSNESPKAKKFDRKKVEPDWIITGDHTVKLRAEGAGEGHRRVYTITLQAQDASGNSATKNVYVPVGKGREDGEHGDGDHGDCKGD
jgi:hypothetical protein